VDILHDTRQFIQQTFCILSGCIVKEEVEAGMAEMSKVYYEAGRELYKGQGDWEHG